MCRPSSGGCFECKVPLANGVPTRAGLYTLDHDLDILPYTDAHRGQGKAAPTTLALIHRGRDGSGAAHTPRMAEGDRSVTETGDQHRGVVVHVSDRTFMQRVLSIMDLLICANRQGRNAHGSVVIPANQDEVVR
jgi:hypothetical protein